MKELFLLLLTIMVLAGCQRGQQPVDQSGALGADSLQLKAKLERSIQEEIRKVFPADSMQFELDELHVKMVDQVFINNHIITQTGVYRSMYQQRANAAIDASQFNKDSAEINRQLAAKWLDTVKMYSTLENNVKHKRVENADQQFYYVQFNFTPIINGKAMPPALAVMFFDKDFKMIEASAPKLL
ncbi:MAG TPA: hypothetical protein VK174_01200 [Chitinophagales bacterium]|nr:hypothetical protein [Chitinophagales bacterium]